MCSKKTNTHSSRAASVCVCLNERLSITKNDRRLGEEKELRLRKRKMAFLSFLFRIREARKRRRPDVNVRLDTHIHY